MVFEALRSEGSDPTDNLALEEALLSLPGDEKALLLFYVNDPCVVVGRNQNPWAEVDPRSDLPVRRRVSGGGAVYHDAGNLNWALFVPRRLHDQDAELAMMAGALRALGFDVEPGARGGLYLDGESAFSGGKVSGTARRFGPRRVLHHGTILVDADLDRLRSSLGGIRPVFSRAVASVPGRPCNLSALRPGLGAEALAADLVSRFASSGLASGAEAGSAEAFLAASGAADAAREARERQLGWDWIWGQTPDFTVSAPAPSGELSIDVKGGRVAGLRGPGAEEHADLLGRRFEYGLSLELAKSGGGAA